MEVGGRRAIETQRSATSPSAGLPEGTVTFVFTDVEGSTRRAFELGDAAWAEVLEVHDRALRRAFADGGHVVNTEGDALFVVYDSAVEAVRGAIDAQRRVGSQEWPHGEPLRVRIGVHTGAALLRGGDYLGAEVHRASRICAAGHGGQIVVSETAAALARAALPEGVELVDLGPHRLKDLAEPQRLFSVEGPDLAAGFPPLRSLDVFAHNLPVQRSSLVGRSGEIAQTRELLEVHQLVTLTGVGGTGKTRLALQVAAEELDRHFDGVFFVDLAPLAAPDLIAGAVVDAAGLQLSGPRSKIDQLVDALGRRRCLLVLDNCEHLLDACADLVDRILAACPDVKVLATSREPLEVEGEQVYRVPSLSLPAERADRSAVGGSDVAASDAVGLFVARAQAVDTGFELTEDNVDAVVQICRRLDGIPLAIEFAAARASHLAPEDIAERIDGRFGLLTGGRRRVRRQQTLEAALDWSFDLLNESERRLLRRLGIFSGGFGLDMVEEACTGDGVDPDTVVDVLGSLVTKSLVTTEKAQGHARYRLLETVRTYAEAKLHDAGESETYRSRHRDAYLAWLESVSWEEHYTDPAVQEALIREHDNLRAALEWSRQQDRRDLVARLACRMHMLWQPGEGHGEEGHQWLSWALEEPARLDRAVQAACELALSYAAMTLLDPGWEQHAARAIEVGGAILGGPVTLAYGMQAVGAASRFVATGDPSAAEVARTAGEEGVRLAGEISGPWRPLVLEFHGQATALLGDLEGAERAFEAAIGGSIARAFHDVLCAELSTCRTLRGDPQAGLEAAQLALGAGPGGRSRPSVHLAVALATVHLGATDDAAASLRTAIATIETRGVFLETNECLTYAGAIAFAVGEVADASRLLSSAATVGDAQSTPIPFRTPASYVLFRDHLPRVRAALDRDEARRLRDEGCAWTVAEAWDAVTRFTERLDR